MSFAKNQADCLNFGHIGWKYYNTIRKKAVEQEFSWSGLFISLSIAFFIVFIGASALHLTYASITDARKTREFLNRKIYYLENVFNYALSIKTALAAGNDYSARPEKNTDFLSMEAGDSVDYTVKLKNTGKKPWFKDKTFLETGPNLRSFSNLKDQSWLKYYQPAKLNKDILPNQTASITFKLTAASGLNGEVQENFQLVINDQPIVGSLFRLFVNLSSETAVIGPGIGQSAKPDFCAALSGSDRADGIQCQTAGSESDSSNGETEDVKTLSKEPIIRVGLFDSASQQKVTCDQSYDIYAGNSLLFANIAANAVTAAEYDPISKLYNVVAGNKIKFSKNFIRFVPKNNQAVMTLLDYDNRPAWNQALNDNRFRNIIELRNSETTGKTWTINELPLDSYLKGLAETSNYSPLDYQKVIATAARTYTLYHYERGLENGLSDSSTKHQSEHFHLDALYDQVYRGYNSEIRLTEMSRAVDQTSGIAVTYDNKIVVTPYFTRSDGQTRAWEKVWYGQAKPWLVSTPVPEDQGQELWGHGVGLSARAALIMVRDKNIGWKEVLKYFYRDIELKSIY